MVRCKLFSELVLFDRNVVLVIFTLEDVTLIANIIHIHGTVLIVVSCIVHCTQILSHKLHIVSFSDRRFPQ